MIYVIVYNIPLQKNVKIETKTSPFHELARDFNHLLIYDVAFLQIFLEYAEGYRSFFDSIVPSLTRGVVAQSVFWHASNLLIIRSRGHVRHLGQK